MSSLHAYFDVISENKSLLEITNEYAAIGASKKSKKKKLEDDAAGVVDPSKRRKRGSNEGYPKNPWARAMLRTGRGEYVLRSKTEKAHPSFAVSAIVRRQFQFQRRHSQRQAINSLRSFVLGKFERLHLRIGNGIQTVDEENEAIQAARPSSSIKFDAEGVLLAAGTSQGYIHLYDFDEYFCVLREKSLTRLPPFQSVQTGFGVEELQWNPRNQSQVAACFSARDIIRLYDMEKGEAVCTLSSGSTSRYAGNASLSFGGTRSLVAGSGDGYVRVWDCRDKSKPKIKMRASRDAANVVLPLKNKKLYVGTASGDVKLWDLRKNVTRIFGAAPEPQCVASWSMPALLRSAVRHLSHLVPKRSELGIFNLMKCPAHGPASFAFQLRCGWSGVLDLENRRVVRLDFPREPRERLYPQWRYAADALASDNEDDDDRLDFSVSLAAHQADGKSKAKSKRDDEVSDTYVRASAVKGCAAFFGCGELMCVGDREQRSVRVVDLSRHQTNCVSDILLDACPLSLDVHPALDAIAASTDDGDVCVIDVPRKSATEK